MTWQRCAITWIVCLLTSCLDCREEVWLNADGSGRFDISYTVPAPIVRLKGGEKGIRDLLDQALADATELQAATHEVTTSDDRTTIRVRARFDSALNLRNLSTQSQNRKLPPGAADLAGQVALKVRGRAVEFTRTITPATALPGSGFLAASNFRSHQLVYIMHLPLAVIDSNATRTQNAGRTLIWEFPLSEAIKAPVTTRFTAQIPIPPWLWFVGAVSALLLTLPAILLIRKRWRKKPRAAPPGK